jgi:hypothetical protein
LRRPRGWGNDIEQGEALDLLSGLVEKSLVVSEPTGDGGYGTDCSSRCANTH